MSEITTTDFLRHGEVAGGHYYRGSTDDPLTTLGWQQMHNAISDQKWEQIICSPLIRCQDFAKTLSKQLNIPLAIEPHWQEFDFGDWEGKTAEQIAPDELHCFYQNPVDNSPPNSEQFSDFLIRINLAWKKTIKQHQGKHILIITHAGVIRSLFPLLLKLPIEQIFHLQVNHASLTRFQCYQEKAEPFVQLQFYNLTAN